MRRAWKLIVLGVLAYVAFLAASVPAGLALSPLQQQLPVEFAGIDGTFWNGRARSVAWDGQALGGLEWRLHPAGLITGSLPADVRLSGPLVNGEGRVAAGLGGSLEARETRLRVSPALVQQLGALPVEIGGDFFLRLETLHLAEGVLPTVTGEVIWREARLTAPFAATLGDYRLALETRENGIHGTITDQGGPFRTSGNLLVRPDGQYQLTLRLVPDANTPADLRDGLKFLGRPDARGAVTLRQQGRLSGLLGSR